MTNCNDCLHEKVCDISGRPMWSILAGKTECSDFKDRENYLEVVRCKDCKHGENIDTKTAPYKYYNPECIVCRCEDVVGDEPMIYPPLHYCSFGERRADHESL